MAFFHGEKGIYFSLNLDPANDDKAYIFKVNKSQLFFALNISKPLLSCATFFLILTGAQGLFDILGLAGITNDDTKTAILLAISALSALIAFSEILLFFSIRKNGKIHGIRNKENNLSLIKQSWEFYAIFVICMFTPFLANVCLPPSAGSFYNDIASSGTLFKIIFYQIILAFLFLSISILIKIYKIIN